MFLQSASAVTLYQINVEDFRHSGVRDEATLIDEKQGLGRYGPHHISFILKWN